MMHSRCLCLLAIASTCAAPVFAQRPSVKTRGSVRVQVQLPDGSPAAGAFIHASVWTQEEGFRANQDYTTDADGWATVRLPGTVQILRLWARRADHVPLFLNWSIREMQQRQVPHEIPESFEFKLPKGTVMSGVVRNEDGEPIEGVDVEVQHRGNIGIAPGVIRLGTWLAEGGGGQGPHGALRTDKNGRWKLTNVPAGDATQVFVKLRHPEYVNDVSWGALQKEQQVTMAAYRDGSAVLVMKRGIRLRGLIVDADTGKPIRGAVVAYGQDPYRDTDSQEVRTNEKGFYEFPPLPVGKVRVTVMAEGYMPRMKQPEINAESARRRLRLDASFRMTRGRTVRLRFTEGGKPVKGVYVSIHSWRGASSLYNHKHPNVLDTKIPHRSDENGIWEWTWAPDDAVRYIIGLQGYVVVPGELPYPGRQGETLISPRDETYEVRLKKAEPDDQ